MQVEALHAEAWEELDARYSRLPHAILFAGQPGSGASEFVLAFAAALLCEDQSTGQKTARQERLQKACGQCQACSWLGEGNHPDFRLLQPDSMAPTSEISAEKEGGDSRKKASNQIKIEQIRFLEELMSVGTHRGGLRVILLQPAEAMNNNAANALLKMLEEPPDKTIFLLLSYQPARLLPTIISRCQRLALPLPPTERAQRYLEAAGVDNMDRWLALAGGVPLLAQELAQQGQSSWIWQLFGHLADGPSADAFATALAIDSASRKHKQSASYTLQQTVLWLQKWLFDLTLRKSDLPVCYFVHEQSKLQELARQTSLVSLTRFYRRLVQAKGEIEQPLNTRLFLEDLLLAYQAMFRRN